MADISNAPIETKLAIKRVKQTYFILNEKMAVLDQPKLVDTKISHTFGFNTDINYVNFTVTFYIHYVDSPNEKLSEITVENIFEVFDLKSYVIEGFANLPEDILVEIVSMATSHTRALFFAALAGTPYQNIIIPVADQRRVAGLLFPGAIELTTRDFDMMNKIKEKNTTESKKASPKKKK